MNQENIAEQLSRHLDGDLDPDEERDLQSRLEGNPELQAELDALREIRTSIAELANRQGVPRELDPVIAPLLRGQPEPVAVRPWLRWFATAAAVVLGATVVVEVQRRDTGPGIESIAKSARETVHGEARERFRLAPLPTSSLPPQEQPLGASDRLLASPIPDLELEEPPPLNVLGPLDEGAWPQARDAELGGEGAAVMMPGKGGATGEAAAGEKGGDKKTGLEEGVGGRTAPHEAQPSAQADDRSDALRAMDAATPIGRAQLFVFIDGGSAWRAFTPESSCKPGRYAVRIVVLGGVVREVRPVGGAASAAPTQRLCAADLVRELEIEGVPDGEYPAEVVVEPRGAGR